MLENLKYNLFERKNGEPKRELTWFEVIVVALVANWLFTRNDN